MTSNFNNNNNNNNQDREEPESIFKTYRKKSALDPAKLGAFILGSSSEYTKFEYYSKKFAEVVEANPEIYEMSKEAVIDFNIKNSIKSKEIATINFVSAQALPLFININFYTQSVGTVGRVMAVPLINLMGSESQKQAWLPSLQKSVWNACYAQTELSHGTDFNSIKTIAVFDVKTDEFVIHTPSLDACKWWPGDLSVYSTHCLLMAQLNVGGKQYGVKPFFIQFRDLVTHELFPGVEVGDVGPTFGYKAKDNGFMR